MADYTKYTKTGSGGTDARDAQATRRVDAHGKSTQRALARRARAMDDTVVALAGGDGAISMTDITSAGE
jgi:hypothetical protein